MYRIIQLKCLALAFHQNGSHPLAATAELFSQAKARLRVSVDFPEALTGERKFD
jgi:hypothetical protein